MKNLLVTVIIILTCVFTSFTQSSIDKVLNDIENNNSTLKFIQKKIEANKIGNKTGIYLQNPEIGFNYLWGSPSVIGNRTDISVNQSFDFPTAYKYKKEIANIKNSQIDFEYEKYKKELMLESRLICLELIHINAVKNELSNRLIHAKSISNSYESKFKSGYANILEYNKAQLNLLNVTKELELQDIKRNVLLDDLTRLNGGKMIEFEDSIFVQKEIPVDFENFYMQSENNNPQMMWMNKEIDLSKREIDLIKAMNLPKLSAGYMSESVSGERFNGISVGFSVPLWENKNTVNYSRANVLVVEEQQTDSKIKLYNKIKMLYNKALAIKRNLNDYKSKLMLYDNSKYLEKALDKGEINLIEYMMEQSIYYDAKNHILEIELELNKTITLMNQFL